MQAVKIGVNYFLQDVDSGFYPIFTYELNRRVKNKEGCVVAVVGEAGVWKSYCAIQLARNIDKRFDIDQIVFTYSEYCRQLQRYKPGLPIVFDEPSYAMGKREWFKEVNQALVKTIESQRFLVRPLIIPIININLLDKTLRDYLIHFQVHCTARGKAIVYRTRASQGEDKIYRYMMCRIEYPILDFDKCQKESCLDCASLETCQLLRAKYERKKRAIQLARYKQDEERTKMKEGKELTNEQICERLRPYLAECMEDGVLKARRIRIVCATKLGFNLGHNRSQIIKTMLELEEKDKGKST